MLERALDGVAMREDAEAPEPDRKPVPTDHPSVPADHAAAPADHVDADGAPDPVRRLLPGGAGNAALDRLAELAARLLEAPIAQVALLSDVHTIVAGFGLPAGVVGAATPLEDSICLVAVGVSHSLAIPDTTVDGRVSHMPAVRSGQVRAYLGVPLHSDSGATVGTLCVLDEAPRLWSDADVALMQQLATSARAELELAALTREYDVDRLHWELAVEASGVGYFDWNLHTGELAWDERLISLYGYDAGDVTFDRSIASVYARLHPDDAQRVGDSMSSAIDAVGPIEVVYRIVLPGGRVRWLEARGRALPGPDGTAARLVGVSWDVTDREAAEFRADRVLAGMPLGYLSVDRDWRITHVNEEGARLAQSTAQEMVGRDLWEGRPQRAGTEFQTVYRRVAATGVPETVEAYYPEPFDAWFEVHVTADAAGIALYYLDVTARRRAQEELDRRAEHDRTVAAALQHALRTTLPDVPGLELAARYATAADEDQVGGDWYDAVRQPDGQLLVVIGDVVGHDIDAAATMGQLRTMVRMLAWDDPNPPSSIIDRLDTAILPMGLRTLATLVVAKIGAPDAATGARRLHWSNAGHPPLIVLHPDGTTQLLSHDRPQLLLGLDTGVDRVDDEYELPAGSTLVLYTDGLVETRHADLDVGIERLRESLRRHHETATQRLVDAVVTDLVGTHPQDDTAVLAIRLRD